MSDKSVRRARSQFLSKFLKLIDDGLHAEFVCWSDDRAFLIIHDLDGFVAIMKAEGVCRTEKQDSVLRNLRNHGFVRVTRKRYPPSLSHLPKRASVWEQTSLHTPPRAANHEPLSPGEERHEFSWIPLEADEDGPTVAHGPYTTSPPPPITKSQDLLNMLPVGLMTLAAQTQTGAAHEASVALHASMEARTTAPDLTMELNKALASLLRPSYQPPNLSRDLPTFHAGTEELNLHGQQNYETYNRQVVGFTPIPASPTIDWSADWVQNYTASLIYNYRPTWCTCWSCSGQFQSSTM